MLNNLFFLLLITSCSLFQTKTSLKSKDPRELLDKVKLTGEGRGRLTLDQNKYLFSVDSVLNEKQDWILAVSIPLHGEEVMILPDIKKSSVDNEEIESFEARIQKEFRRLRVSKNLSADQFIKELRSMIKFILSPSWGENRDCAESQEGLSCTQDKQKFIVKTNDNELIVKKIIRKKISLELEARNLTDSFFTQNNIKLYFSERESVQKESTFSLELFW
jgi:hypothetical protein